MKQRTFLTAIIGVLFLGAISLVMAAEPGEGAVASQNDLGQYVLASGDTVSIEAGNVTAVSVSANMSTVRWAGLIGNASGQIVLGDSSNNTLYSWSASVNLVFAAEAATVDWDNIDGATFGDFPAYTVGNYSDNASITFDQALTDVGALSNLFTTVTDAPTSGTRNLTTLTAWDTYALTDGVNLLFAGEVYANGAQSYRNTTVNFQMIIPEDGTNGDLAVTAYNMWIELI